ncbi:flippase [Methanolobus sediminis]|uniref:Flippase n=1 Tax=Methanolobus sediminis TaxID=3072978 RepID=A0AA51ULQ5_9EURY|nr:flippase [Methanolobus sediminis]WMW24305.1 flippase [Methanolobus sediminis]
MSIGSIQRQAIVSFVWQITFTFVGLLSTIYFARTVGAGVLGEYFLFLAYLSIISLMTDGGLGGAAIKRISEGEEPDTYFSAFVVLRSFFMMLVLVTLIVLRTCFEELNNSGIFIWLILALIVSLLHGAVSSSMAGCGKIGIQSTATFINNISRIFFQVFAVFLGFGISGLAGGFVFGLFVGSIVQLHFFDLRFVRFEWKHVKSLWSFSLWTFLISAGMIVYSTADTIMLGYYLSNADVGVYRIALQFTALATFATDALRVTLWPRVSRWGIVGEIGLIEDSLSRAFTYSLVLAIPIFVGGVLLGDKLLYYFYGAEFGRGYMTMVLLFIVQLVNIFQFISTSYLSALDHLKDLLRITMVAVVANIVLNAILIPVIGIEGAAIATFITMGLNAVLAMWVLSKILTIRVESESLMNILKASFLMSLFVGGYRMIVPLSNIWLVLVPVIVGGGIYGILVLNFDRKILGEFNMICTNLIKNTK